MALLILLALGWAATRQADDHTSRSDAATAALRRSGIDAARAEVTGLGATVYGLADSEFEREQALQAVRQVAGLRDVTDRLTVEPRPASAPLRQEGNPELAPTLDNGPRLATGAAFSVAAAPVRPAAPRLARSAPAAPAPGVSPTTQPSNASTARRTAPARQVPVDASCASIPPVLEGAWVSFADRSATVLSASKTTLSSVARYMLRCPQIVLRIDGHATEANSPADNLQLSRLRSQAVSNHLNVHGVPISRLVATYRGDRSPSGDHAVLTMHAEGSR